MKPDHERIAERFADEVVSRLGQYDQLGSSRPYESERSRSGELLAQSVATTLLAGVTPEQRADLRAAFLKSLLGSSGYTTADADYHADHRTASILKSAGVDPTLFPIKSRFQVLRYWPREGDPEVVGLFVQSGYGAPRAYHWPLADGRWLTTDLDLTGTAARASLLALALSGTVPDGWSVA